MSARGGVGNLDRVRPAKLTALAAAVALALAIPATGHAALATIESRDVPLGARSLATTHAPERFNLVGIHWQGSGRVAFRTRSLAGRWSGWRDAAPEEEDGPDPASRERSVRGWRLGNPYWTGASNAIAYRVRGSVRKLRAWFVWSPVGAPPTRTLAMPAAPAVIPRLSWGANELIKRAPPSYADTVRFAVVHHTAGSNTYTRAQSAAIVRAIQLYHVRGNGWDDIGYNLLVDKYGQVFEGRFGGVDRNVIGAHAGGFNVGSVGVAVLGNYDGVGISAAARAALVKTLAWRLDVAHVDPLSMLTAVSGGNARFPSGIPVFLRAVSGHRETGFTDCPGDRLYAAIDTLARAVAATGLPKLYAPSARGSVGGPIRITARLSAALPWTVTITDAERRAVAAGAGTGTVVDWTWDSRGAPQGSYAYTIAAGANVRPATGPLGPRATALTLTARVAPTTVTPNGDGRNDAAVISYRLGAPATVTATLTSAGGAQLATLFVEPKTAGNHRFVFTAEGVADGTYRIVLSAADATGRRVAASVSVTVSRNVSSFAAVPTSFSPNGDGRRDTIAFGFRLDAAAQVRLRIVRGAAPVATPFAGRLGPGPHSVTWDGTTAGARAADGRYVAELAVTDLTPPPVHRVPIVVDTASPRIRIIRLRPLLVRVTEPGTLVIVADGRRRTQRVAKAGSARVAMSPRRISAYLEDAAGNRSRVVRPP